MKKQDIDSQSVHHVAFVSSKKFVSLELRYTERLTYHHRGPRTEDEAHEMNIAMSPRLPPNGHNTTGNALLSLDPTVLDPVREEPDQRQRGRDGQPLEITCLSGSVLGHQRHGGIEPGKTGESAADKAGQRDGVESRPKADDKGQYRRRYSERYLRTSKYHVSRRIMSGARRGNVPNLPASRALAPTCCSISSNGRPSRLGSQI